MKIRWDESIKEAMAAKENNRLVIFVGAGVSANSNIPTWRQLIEIIANKIDYCGKSKGCTKKSDACLTTYCEDRYQFTPNEFMRIPEYYHQKSACEYYATLNDVLLNSTESNPIDNIIFDILPNHIITTNFDCLLENSKSFYTNLYQVVSQDKDLLSYASDHYIIKMHGDLSNPQNIVLKESDFFAYEQNYPLVSTFIKSLLVNHTFVFIGYSLNDINLNMILGWIDHFCKKQDVQNRPKNFLVLNEEVSDFEYKRLSYKSVYPINLNELPDDLVRNAKVPAALKGKTPQVLYAYLKCLSDYSLFKKHTDLKKIILEQFQTLKSYNRIAFIDLLSNCSLGPVDLLQNHIRFFDRNKYNEVVTLLQDEGILEVFQRAGIGSIFCKESKETPYFEIPKIAYPSQDVFQLYLDNDYTQIVNQHLNNLSLAEQIYYRKIIGITDSIEELIERATIELSKCDFVDITLHKTRSRLATISLFNDQQERRRELSRLIGIPPQNYKNSILFLKKIIESSTDDELKMHHHLAKQQERVNNKGTIYFEDAHIELWYLQGYIYNYYDFITRNNLPLIGFLESKRYFSYYIEAILCSYMPIIENEETFWGHLPRIRPYALNEKDIDIFIKFNNDKVFESWIKKYKVLKIKIEEEIDIVKKFKNFCNSLLNFYRREQYLEQLQCFLILISHMEIDDKCREEISTYFVEMILNFYKKEPNSIFSLYPHIEYFAVNFETKSEDMSFALLSKCFFDDSLNEKLESRYGEFAGTRLLVKYAPLISKTTIDRKINEIKDEKDASRKCNLVYKYRYFINEELYKEYLADNFQLLPYRRVTQLIVEKRIPYTDSTQLFFETVLNKELANRTAGAKTYPDHLVVCLECCLLLHLMKFPVNLSRLKKYREWSEHIAFVLDPSTYDYSIIDLNNYMWQNLFFSNEYQHFFIDHKNEILTPELEKQFIFEQATQIQQKIVFGYLLDRDNIQTYADKKKI